MVGWACNVTMEEAAGLRKGFSFGHATLKNTLCKPRAGRQTLDSLVTNQEAPTIVAAVQFSSGSRSGARLTLVSSDDQLLLDQQSHVCAKCLVRFQNPGSRFLSGHCRFGRENGTCRTPMRDCRPLHGRSLPSPWSHPNEPRAPSRTGLRDSGNLNAPRPAG